MASINFPDPATNNPNTGSPWADGDTFTTTQDGLQLTYIFKKPASPNTSSWWKAAGVLNNNPNNRIAQGNSSVAVTDTGSDGNVLIVTEGGDRMKVTSDGTVKLNGTNIDSDPSIQLNPNGSSVFEGLLSTDLSADNTAIALKVSGTTKGSLGTSGNDFIIGHAAAGTGNIALQTKPGSGPPTYKAYLTNAGNFLIGGTLPGTPNISLNADGRASFASDITCAQELITGTGAYLVIDRDAAASSSNILLRGDQQGNEVFRVTTDGSAEFAGIVDSGDPLGTAGSRLNPNGQVYSRNTGSNVIFEGGTNVKSNFKVKADGSASFDGKITLTGDGSVDGIQFGTTDSGGDITSQTLDDYEEGTWTPTINSVSNNASVTVTLGSVSSNFYTKIGNKVLVTCRLPLTSSDNSAQVAVGDRITILPSSLPFPILGRGVTGTLMTNLDNPAPVRAAIFTAGDNQLSFVCVYKQGSISYASNYELTISYLANT